MEHYVGRYSGDVIKLQREYNMWMSDVANLIIKEKKMTLVEAYKTASNGDKLIWACDSDNEAQWTITKFRTPNTLEWDTGHPISQCRLLGDDWRVLRAGCVKITCEGKTVEISRESAKALNLI